MAMIHTSESEKLKSMIRQRIADLELSLCILIECTGDPDQIVKIRYWLRVLALALADISIDGNELNAALYGE